MEVLIITMETEWDWDTELHDAPGLKPTDLAMIARSLFCDFGSGVSVIFGEN